jgi:hypothetical protein
VSMDDGFALLHSRVSGLSKPQEKEGNGALMDSLDATGAI